jgi:antitoxin ParD1/3/4
MGGYYRSSRAEHLADHGVASSHGDFSASPGTQVGVFRKFDRDSQSVYFSVMHISLTPELEKAVKAKVKSGLYNNASEVVREALRQVLAREHENDWLAREAAIGFAQLEAGQTVTVDSKEQFMALVREEA